MDYKKKLITYLGSEVLKPFNTNMIIKNLLENNSFVALANNNFLDINSHLYYVCQEIQPYDSDIEKGFDMIRFYIDKFPIVKENELYGFKFIADDKAYIQAISTDRQLEKELVREEIKVPDFSGYNKQDNLTNSLESM